MQRNIVFIVLDQLRFDRMTHAGYGPATTPSLDRLARTGLTCSNLFATGCPTQVAFPAIFTSTLPLDCGGYGDGINSRPVAFPEVLQEAGYHTVGISPAQAVTTYWGYDRGFDDYVNFVDIDHWFRGASVTTLHEPIVEWAEGHRSDADISGFLSGKYSEILETGLRYIDNLDRVQAPERGRKRADWVAPIAAELALLASDPMAIARKLAALGSQYHMAMGSPKADKALLEGFEQTKRRNSRLNKYITLRTARDGYQSHEVNQQIVRFLKHRKEGPFFAFIHYLDIHESKMMLPTMQWRRALELPADAYRALKGRPNRHPTDILYDLNVAYTDRQLGRLLHLFERAGLMSNTVFVITADHGMDSEPDSRGVRSDLSRMFYDDFLHVPLIIWGAGIEPGTSDALMSHLDLAPTICQLAGIRPSRDFQGLSLDQRMAQPAAHVVAENTGRGRCDIAAKPIYIGVRSNDFKVVYEASDYQAREREVYDLAKDPKEKINLVASDDGAEARAQLRHTAEQRLQQLKLENGVSQRQVVTPTSW